MNKNLKSTLIALVMAITLSRGLSAAQAHELERRPVADKRPLTMQIQNFVSARPLALLGRPVVQRHGVYVNRNRPVQQ